LIEGIGAVLDADTRASGRAHLWGPAAESEMTFEDCANASDAMIADVSAVVSDYLFSEKPFSIVSMGGSSEALVATAPVALAAYILAGDLSNLDEVLDELLMSDSLLQRRQEIKTYYLGSRGAADYADGFLETARRYIDRAPATAPTFVSLPTSGGVRLP
jgi:hypothetical protein